MSVAVIVPRTPGSCRHRDTNWAWLKARWGSLHPTWETVEGNADPDRWCKAEAVADALEHTAAETLVICDADLVCDPIALARSVDALDVGASWVVPYTSVRRLTAPATATVIDQPPETVDLPTDRSSLARQPYSSLPGGGVLVLRRSTYLAAGGFPPFVGWGGEDVAFGLVLRTLAGKHTRIRSDLWHLWHPPQSGRRPGGRSDNDRLTRRYIAAKDNPAAMSALVEQEVRT